MATTGHSTLPVPAQPEPVSALRQEPDARPERPRWRPGQQDGSGVRPPLRAALIKAALPAYLGPGLMTSAAAVVVGSQLAVAGWTTIGIPSAAAAVLVALWTRRRIPPPRPGAGRSARAFAVAALPCALLAGAGSAVLIGTGVLSLSVLQYTLVGAALGGGLTAVLWARGGRVSRAGVSGSR